jgi:hypothetical protein
MKFDGFDEMSRHFEQVAAALRNLDGDLGAFSMNPNDEASVTSAIAEAHVKIDSTVGDYTNNPC